MSCYAKNGSILDLARLFFGYLSPADSEVAVSEPGRLPPHDFDPAKFRDEIRYLRAFAIHYSTCLILGESPEGNGLRTAFMRIWDDASRAGAADMESYDEFFKRIELYGGLLNAEKPLPLAQAADQISRKFAELLGKRTDSPWLTHFATCAATHFNNTCSAVAEALKKTELRASMSL